MNDLSHGKDRYLPALALIALTGCAAHPVQPVEHAKSVPTAPRPEPVKPVSATILGGETPAPTIVRHDHAEAKPSGPGTIEFNIPSADVHTLAQIVLRDTLHIPYTVAVEGDVTVGLSTSGPVTRSQLLDLFEAALKKADLAMVWQGNGYKIETVAAARAENTGFLPDRGFGTETVTLQFANAEELKKLLDSVVPGAVQQVDRNRNTLVLSGTEAQRKGAHDIIAQFDVNWLRSMAFALFVPQRTDSRLIVPELDRLLNAADAPTRGLVRLIAMEKLNGVIAISPQKQYLEDVRRWIEVLDREGTNNEARLYVYRVQNSRARDLVKTINATFGMAGATGASGNAGTGTDGTDAGNDANQPNGLANGAPPPGPAGPGATGLAPRQAPGGGSGRPALAVRVSADEINNAVVVYGNAHDYSIVEDALRKLDVPPMQVMIEAAITEVDLNDDLRYGVQWNFAKGSSTVAYSEGTSGIPVSVFPGFSYFYSSNDINGTLNALEGRTKIKVVSAPKLMVLNNQTAALQVGDQVPVETQQAQNLQSSTSALVSSIEYKDTGVILKITPRVNASGSVLLDIAQEVSDVATTSTSNINSPTITTRKVATTIAVQDGQVVALGGLFRDSKQVDRNGVPVLSRIPVLGGLLFGKNTTTMRKTELLVLIKPHVLRSTDDIAAITEEMRQKITSVEPFKSKGKIP